MDPTLLPVAATPSFLQTTLITLVISIFGSAVTLIIGIRVGKNQADRAELQRKYAALRQHFLKMLNNLKKGYPLTWGEFGKWDNHKPETSSAVFNGREEGTLLILPTSILDDLERVEKEAFDLSEEMHRLGNMLWGHVRGEIQRMHVQDVSITNKGELISIGRKGVSDYYNLECPFLALLFKNEESSTFLETLKIRDDVGVRLGMKHFKELEIAPHTLDSTSESTLHFLQQLIQFAEGQPQYSSLVQEKSKVEEQISQLIKKLENLSRDPHPLLETMWLSIKDLYKE